MALADLDSRVLAVLLFLLSLFLVFLIMIQRGKGGGIAGSLTGTAQSAFGARGGDMLMWWTIALYRRLDFPFLYHDLLLQQPQQRIC